MVKISGKDASSELSMASLKARGFIHFISLAHLHVDP